MKKEDIIKEIDSIQEEIENRMNSIETGKEEYEFLQKINDRLLNLE